MPSKLPLTAEFVEKISSIMLKNDLNEVELEENGTKLSVKRGAVASSATVIASPLSSAPASVPAPGPAPASVSASIPVSASAPAGESKGEGAGEGAVTSPMVGTVYLASSPGAKGFCKVGDKVEKGQTLLIIEAMKVMNQIIAPIAGVVEAIHVGDSEPVEFGDILVTVRPD